MPKKADYVLRKPQVRILKALAKSKSRHGLTRAEIAEAASVSPSMTANLGPLDPKQVKTIEGKYGKRSLMELKYVESREIPANLDDDTGEATSFYLRYLITDAGKQALETLK